MVEYRIRFVIALAAVSLLSASSMASAETWHLNKQGQDFKPVDRAGTGQTKGEDEYLLAVAQIKKFVSAGQSEAAETAVAKLKKDFPEIATPDMDAFFKAELLFCKGKFAKAVRSYDRFLAKYPQSQLTDAALDRQFAIATAFLAGEKKRILKVFKIRGYAEGERIMERIIDRAGDAPIAVKAAVGVAKSLEKRARFNEAYQKWSQIISRWPPLPSAGGSKGGQIGRDALLAMARCQHAAYKGPKYNASSLIGARSYYENFKLRYPTEAAEFDIDARLKQINEQLAYKQFSIGEYYQKTGDKQSANFYYQMVVDNWPATTTAKMAREMIN